jgi:hypothetical protein
MLGARLDNKNNEELSSPITPKAPINTSSVPKQAEDGLELQQIDASAKVNEIKISGKRTILRPQNASVFVEQDSKTPPSHLISQIGANLTPREGTFARFAAEIDKKVKKKAVFGAANELGFSVSKINKEIGISIETKEDKKNTSLDTLLGKRATRSQTKATKLEEQESLKRLS